MPDEKQAEDFVPQVFIRDDTIYQTLSPHRLPVGKWVTFDDVPELDLRFQLVLAMPVAEVWR